MRVNLDIGYALGPDASFVDWCRQPFPGGAGSHRPNTLSANHISSSDGLQRPGIRRIDWTFASGPGHETGRGFDAKDFYSSTTLSDRRERMVETSLRVQPVGPSIALEPRALRASNRSEFARRSGVARHPDSSTFLMMLLGVGLMVLVVRRRI
jgi:hypothetical protein